MKHLGLLVMSSLAAACASNPPPPAASSETVVAATDTPSSSTTPVETDMTRAADADRRAEMAAPGPATNSPRTDNSAAGPRPADTIAPATTPAPAANTANTTTTAPATPSTQTPAEGGQPDNSRVNTRDRSGDTLTPTDQGGSDADIKLTQQIRQAVMKDDTLSFTAKNVKIITVNGKVTLRGPVKTAQERTAIEAAARKIAGVTQVENLLEIKK
jgi:hypothetical protein